MLRAVNFTLSRLGGSLLKSGGPASTRAMSKASLESEEEMDSRYKNYFERADIDGWQVRKAMNDLCGMDLVPTPEIVKAALKACRRLDDYALAIRFLEAVKFKCGPSVGTIYPYIVQEITPTLEELGLELPEKLGYDKPELALPNVYDMH